MIARTDALNIFMCIQYEHFKLYSDPRQERTCNAQDDKSIMGYQ